jgi:hypothetical protein
MDLHWAAGFLEGEGCFSQNKGSQVIVGVQVQREPLERLQRLFGGVVKVRASRISTHRPRHVWRVCGARARGVMQTLYSIMSPWRRQQIERALGRS